MKIVEVSNSIEVKKFHQVPHLIYKKDTNWISHIKQEVEAVFDPKKKQLFHGRISNPISTRKQPRRNHR